MLTPRESLLVQLMQGLSAEEVSGIAAAPREPKAEEKPNVPRMRTVKQAVQYFREKDPESCVTEHFVWRLIKTGVLPTVCTGRKQRVNLDTLEEYLRSPPAAPKPAEEPKRGELRRIAFR